MLKELPKVSIVMAVYNGMPWLKETIKSVENQSYNNYEFIIVDDNSNDGTSEFLHNLKNHKIRHFKNETNIGQTASLNKGVSSAVGQYLARIDADDTWDCKKLEKQIEYLQKFPEIDVLGTNTICIDADGRIIGKENYPLDNEMALAKLLNVPPVCHVSVLLKIETLKTIGLYPEEYKYAADYAAWSKMAQMGFKFSNLSSRLTFYRQYPNSYGASKRFGLANKEAAQIIQEYIKVMCKIDLSFDECKNIDLIYKPESGLTTLQILEAYTNLKKCYKIILTKNKIGSLFSLWLGLVWTFGKKRKKQKHTDKLNNLHFKKVGYFFEYSLDAICAYFIGRCFSVIPFALLIKIKVFLRHLFKL